jgi:hypothetical protein
MVYRETFRMNQRDFDDEKQELLNEVIEIGNNNGYITYDDIMDVVEGDRELFNFINDELDKIKNDLLFELDL